MKVTTLGEIDMTSDQAEAVSTLIYDWRHTTGLVDVYQVEETMQIVLETETGTVDVLQDGSIHS